MTQSRLASSLVLLLLSLISHTALGNWEGCIDPNNPTSSDLVKIGSPHSICITIGPTGHWSEGVEYLHFIFRPKADEYARFHIPDSYRDLVNDEQTPLKGNLTVHVSSQTGLSFLRQYHDADNFRIFPYLTAIIDVDKGRVRGIAWDDACVFCSNNKCEENMFDFNGVSSVALNVNEPSRGCYFMQEQCNEIINNNGVDCDITVYVVWTGTDSNGNSFQSSNYRFSAFPAKRLQDRISISNPFA